jgi:DNA-binding FrmR family transcriptional regulator
MSSAVARDNLVKRLQRMEGQVRGVCHMVEEGRDCQDILTQLAAIRGALHQISVMVVQEYAVHCLTDPDTDGLSGETVAKLIQTLGQMPH